MASIDQKGALDQRLGKGYLHSVREDEWNDSTLELHSSCSRGSSNAKPEPACGRPLWVLGLQGSVEGCKEDGGGGHLQLCYADFQVLNVSHDIQSEKARK